jgi:hypothetical protein
VTCRLCQSKANEATKRQIEAHGKKLDIMRAQHDEVMGLWWLLWLWLWVWVWLW